MLLKVWVLSSTFTFAQNNSIITLQKQIIKEAKPERIYALKLSLASAIKQNKPDSAILLSKDALKFFIYNTLPGTTSAAGVKAVKAG